jgi:hypothetical protein
MTLRIAEVDPLQPEQLAEWLRWTWKRTEVTRLRISRVAPVHQQMTFEQ